jgi:hypothetical protein
MKSREITFRGIRTGGELYSLGFNIRLPTTRGSSHSNISVLLFGKGLTRPGDLIGSVCLNQPTGTVLLQIQTLLHSTASLPHAPSPSVQEYGNEAIAPDKNA